MISLKIKCNCGTDFRFHTNHHPPKMSFCPGCRLPLLMIRYNEETKEVEFRRLKPQ